jgi:DNA-directed RNA polymerase subunit RPC12/RpoP
MEVIACPNCGSRKIFQGRLRDGLLTGYTSKNVCRECGYQGMPIIFDSETDYIKFLKSKKSG